MHILTKINSYTSCYSIYSNNIQISSHGLINNSSNSRLFLTVSHPCSGLSVGNFLTKHRFHFVEPNPWPFLAQQHPNHNLAHNYNTSHTQTVCGLSKTRLKLPACSPKFSGLIKRPHTIQSINKTLKKGLNQVRENPYLFELSKLHTIDAYA